MVEQVCSFEVNDDNDGLEVMGSTKIIEEFDDEKMMKNVLNID